MKVHADGGMTNPDLVHARTGDGHGLPLKLVRPAWLPQDDGVAYLRSHLHNVISMAAESCSSIATGLMPVEQPLRISRIVRSIIVGPPRLPVQHDLHFNLLHRLHCEGKNLLRNDLVRFFKEPFLQATSCPQVRQILRNIGKRETAQRAVALPIEGVSPPTIRVDMSHSPSTSGSSHLFEGVLLGVSRLNRNQKLSKFTVFSAPFRFRPGGPVKSIAYNSFFLNYYTISSVANRPHLRFRFRTSDRGSI